MGEMWARSGRDMGEIWARYEARWPAEVDAEVDHDQVSDEHVQYHRRAVGIPGSG